MASMLLGERLTNLMELQNTNNKQVCESLHIHPSTFSGYLSGKRQPSYDILMRMAAYFHTTCDYLLGYTPLTTHLPSCMPVVNCHRKVRKCSGKKSNLLYATIIDRTNAHTAP